MGLGMDGRKSGRTELIIRGMAVGNRAGHPVAGTQG
jgi:hypothetical protein